jgi:riboflavin kinase / FMN adenylyltransferase
MQIHHLDVADDTEALNIPGGAVVTSGTFDGVHVGHQKILERLKEIAARMGGETVVITFWPHPRFVLHPEEHTLKLLSTFDEKIALLENLGIEHLVRIPFTPSFSQLSSDAFIRKVLIEKVGTRQLVIGYNHRFGHNREGSFEYLIEHAKEYGFALEEIPEQDVDHVAVSSTKIRNALEEGDVKTAHEYLGRPYTLSGKVVSGDRIGRNLGFPTANIQIPEPYKLIPADGAYAVRVEWQNRLWDGMMNIGYRPTVSGNKKQTLEVHIFDFDEQIYDQTLRVQFIGLIRKEMKFEGVEALQAQLAKDRLAAQKILSKE